MRQALKAFKKILKEKGLKYTKQREAIAKRIFSTRSHFSAQELYESLKDKENISRATVYRTLNLMVEYHIIEEHDFGRGKKFYEYTMGQESHNHLICLNCGKIEEFRSTKIEDLVDEVSQRLNFKVNRYSFNIYGYCDACRQRVMSSNS